MCSWHYQSRVLAAESLHALILYMIGQSATYPQRSKHSLFSSCYEIIFPVVISLSSSTDVMCRDIFNKLLTQIIHWFSAMEEVHKDEVEVLLTALVNGVCDDSDAMMRETCAKGLGEFFHWAVKQSSLRGLTGEEGGGTVSAVLDRLIVLSQNPAESKRLGSALVRSKFYTYYHY